MDAREIRYVTLIIIVNVSITRAPDLPHFAAYLTERAQRSSSPTMMKTRRTGRSKSSTSATATSSRSARVEGTHSLTIVTPEDLDVDALSSLVPDVDLSEPNSEVIISVYRLLLQHVAELNATQRQLDESRAEVEKKDVELDQALQDRESMSKELEQSQESALVQLEKAKREKDQLGTHCNVS